MIVGQMFGPDLFLITSNSGICLYMIAMTRVLYEIRHDIRQAGDLGNFLIALENVRSEKNREENTRIQDNSDELSEAARSNVGDDKEKGQLEQPQVV